MAQRCNTRNDVVHGVSGDLDRFDHPLWTTTLVKWLPFPFYGVYKGPGLSLLLRLIRSCPVIDHDYPIYSFSPLGRYKKYIGCSPSRWRCHLHVGAVFRKWIWIPGSNSVTCRPCSVRAPSVFCLVGVGAPEPRAVGVGILAGYPPIAWRVPPCRAHPA